MVFVGFYYRLVRRFGTVRLRQQPVFTNLRVDCQRACLPPYNNRDGYAPIAVMVGYAGSTRLKLWVVAVVMAFGFYRFVPTRLQHYRFTLTASKLRLKV